MMIAMLPMLQPMIAPMEEMAERIENDEFATADEAMQAMQKLVGGAMGNMKPPTPGAGDEAEPPPGPAPAPAPAPAPDVEGAGAAGGWLLPDQVEPDDTSAGGEVKYNNVPLRGVGVLIRHPDTPLKQSGMSEEMKKQLNPNPPPPPDPSLTPISSYHIIWVERDGEAHMVIQEGHIDMFEGWPLDPMEDLFLKVMIRGSKENLSLGYLEGNLREVPTEKFPALAIPVGWPVPPGLKPTTLDGEESAEVQYVGLCEFYEVPAMPAGGKILTVMGMQTDWPDEQP
jgi:hypothetical protein